MTQDDIIRMAREACPYTTDEMRGAFYEGFLKGAVAEREACAKVCEEGGRDESGRIHVQAWGCAKAIRARGQALKQPEPEPVKCHTCKGLGRIYMGCGSWIHCDTCNTTGKATTPSKREWQGLTDEEVQMFIDARWGDGVNFTHFIRAIEAKLKEKNT